MAHSHIVSPIKQLPTPSSIPAQPDKEWGRLMRETTASPIVPQRDPASLPIESDRFDMDTQAQNLQREISRMISEYLTLSQTAGRAQAHQQNQINMLMTMIASLSRKITFDGNPGSHQTGQVYGLMSSLQSELAAQRARSRSEGATAGVILGQIQGMQGNLERALSQILQQLSSLHMRMGSLT